MTYESQKQIERMIKVVERFNADLEKYYKETDSHELPIIECTIEGYEELYPADIQRTENGFDCNLDGYVNHIEVVVEDGEEYIRGWEDWGDGLKDGIAYERKRLRKAWRIWHSENPDAELAKQDDED